MHSIIWPIFYSFFSFYFFIFSLLFFLFLFLSFSFFLSRSIIQIIFNLSNHHKENEKRRTFVVSKVLKDALYLSYFIMKKVYGANSLNFLSFILCVLKLGGFGNLGKYYQVCRIFNERLHDFCLEFHSKLLYFTCNKVTCFSKKFKR